MHDWQRGFLMASMVLGALFTPASEAQEIAPFRLTGVEGWASIGYWNDKFQTQQSSPGGLGSSTSLTTQTDTRVDVFVMTHSYIYHPNLMTLDFGLGPVFERATYSTDGDTTRSQPTLYNLDARATFLRDKPYRGSVYYQHLNPTVLVSPGEALLEQTTQYGFDFSLLAPTSPVPLTLEAWRLDTQGKSAQRFVDSQADQVSLRSSVPINGYGNSEFRYVGVQQESANGSPNLPIQTTALTSNGVSLDSYFRFGEDRQWSLTNPINYTTQKYAIQGGQLLNLDTLTAMFDFQGTQSEALTTRVRYNVNSTVQNDFRNNSQTLGAGLNYVAGPNLTAVANVAGEVDRATNINFNRLGINGNLHYKHPLAIGVASVNYGLLLAKRDQIAKAATGSVFGEQVPLSGTLAVPLQNEIVVSGSVVVNNPTRTQVYVEGLDYLLTVVGLRTRIERLAAGNILSGETVLVDYSYETGGTFAYQQFDNSLELGWSLGSYASLRVRYFDGKVTLTSGQPLFELNSVRAWLAIAQADVPIRGATDLYAGGSAELEDHWETISPYRRQSASGYIQSSLPTLEWAGLRIGARRAHTDYLDPASADVKLTAYTLMAWANSPLGVDFMLDIATERDTGGVAPRSYDYATLKALWRVRRVTLTLTGSYSRETQGDFNKKRAYTQLLARREF